MELDELKQLLNKRIEPRQEKSPEDISLLLQQDTKSILQKLKRSLWIELSLAIVFTITCIAVAFITSAWSIRIYFTVFAFIGAIFIIILPMLIKKTNETSSTAPVKQNLLSYLSIIKEYVKRYFQMGMALLPVCFAFAYWLAYHDPEKTGKPFRWDVFAYLLLYLAAVSIGYYCFTKWYLKKLYGRYIAELENDLKELEE